MLDWTERVTLALVVVFAVTFSLTMYAANPTVWLVWAVAMVLLAGTALLAVNRTGPPSDGGR